MNPIPLTARQINTLDNINAAQSSAEATLKVALTYHANTVEECEKAKKAFWRDLADLHGLDVFTIRYEIAMVDGTLSIRLKETGEPE